MINYDTNSAEFELWSPRAERLLQDLAPRAAQPSRRAPAGSGGYRHEDSVAALEGLLNATRDIAEEALEDFVLAPRIAFLGEVSYSSDADPVVTGLSLQAFVTPDSTIETVRQHRAGNVLYIRLDYDTQAGNFVDHPMLHLHVLGNDDPRIPVRSVNASNPVLWFLEFLTIHYDSDSWIDWVARVGRRIPSASRILQSLFLRERAALSPRHLSEWTGLMRQAARAKRLRVKPMTFKPGDEPWRDYSLG